MRARPTRPLHLDVLFCFSWHLLMTIASVYASTHPSLTFAYSFFSFFSSWYLHMVSTSVHASTHLHVLLLFSFLFFPGHLRPFCMYICNDIVASDTCFTYRSEKRSEKTTSTGRRIPRKTVFVCFTVHSVNGARMLSFTPESVWRMYTWGHRLTF
jgi:hypothetical protein